MQDATGSEIGLLLLSVWLHDGHLVGRLRVVDALDDPARDLAVADGPTAIAAVVEEWLCTLDPGRTDESDAAAPLT